MNTLFAGAVFDGSNSWLLLAAMAMFALILIGFIALIVWSIVLLRKGGADKRKQLFGIIGLLLALGIMVFLQRII